VGARSLAELDPATLAAIAKLASDAAKAGERPAVGLHKINGMYTLLLEGSVKVGPDTVKAPTCSIPLLATMGLLVKKLGIQRDKALKTIREAMLEALALDKDAAAQLERESGVLDAERAIKEQVIANLPKTPVKGPLRVNATAELR
jgi:hypothetical protein